MVREPFQVNTTFSLNKSSRKNSHSFYSRMKNIPLNFCQKKKKNQFSRSDRISLTPTPILSFSYAFLLNKCLRTQYNYTSFALLYYISHPTYKVMVSCIFLVGRATGQGGLRVKETKNSWLKTRYALGR